MEDPEPTRTAEEPPEAPEQPTGAPPDECKPQQPPLVVIDASPEERARLEASAEELGRPVLAFDPAGLRAQRILQLEGMAGIVVAWDLGGRSGLDWVEALAPHAAARAIPILMASEAATRARVAMAVRAGAKGFLSRPYDLDELRVAIGEPEDPER